MKLCCASAGGLDAIHRATLNVVIPGRVFTPHEEISFFSVKKTDVEAPMWEKLGLERFKIGMSACYSSVFGEHWVTRFGKPQPVSVMSCDSLTGPSYDSNLNAQGI